MKRYVRSKEYHMVGLANEEQDGYTWVTFVRGKVGQWRPNDDLEDIAPVSEDEVSDDEELRRAMAAQQAIDAAAAADEWDKQQKAAEEKRKKDEEK